MTNRIFHKCFSLLILPTLGLISSPAFGAKPTLPSAEQTLELTPVQTDVDFDQPTKTQVAKCVVEVEKAAGSNCYVVRNEAGQTLRRFADTNGDAKVDTWCYFKDGIEVYRDLDTDGNGKADQYRWFGVAGMRWGIDKNEDGQIDSWKDISAEEVSEEVVAAIRLKDAARFQRVLLTSSEAEAIGISAERATELRRTIAAAPKEFTALVQSQKIVQPKSTWVSFGGGKPGMVPQFGEKNEGWIVYDNAAAVVETDGKHAQVGIGTIVQTDAGWRVIDVPRNLLDEANSSGIAGFFFQAPLAKSDESATSAEGGVSPEMQKWVAELEKVDKDLAAATTASQQAKLNTVRADLVERIASLTKGEDRETWIKQYAETVSAAVQSGGFPEGTKRLKGLTAQLAKESGQENLVVFVGFRALQTDYNQSLVSADGKESEIGKIREAWIAGLEKLVGDYGSSSEAAEPMLALAQECELEGKEEQAIKWYARIATDFAKSPFAAKALGAKRRLECLGKTFAISGNTIDGKPFNASELVGKVTVVYYWASWYDRFKEDATTLKALQTKYGRGFQVVSVNLDSNRDDAMKTLKSAGLTWPTLYENGGFESRYANEMGVFSLPIAVLLDTKGKVLSRTVNVGEIETEIRKHFK
jgi:thiol-disulfide isomerase/thioredoxin